MATRTEELAAQAGRRREGRFSANLRMPSTAVTKELIRSIEQYLLRRSGQDFAVTKLRMSIIDPLGAEMMASIDDFLPLRFTDATEAVRIRFIASSNKPPQELDVALAFARKRDDSVIGVEYAGPHPREFVQGTLDGLRQCLSSHEAHTGIYNLPSYAQGIVVGVGTGLTAFLGVTFSFPVLVFALNIAAVLIGWFFVVTPKMRPYCLFDTAKNERIGQRWTWLQRSIVGFMLFTVILGAVRDEVVALIRDAL